MSSSEDGGTHQRCGGKREGIVGGEAECTILTSAASRNCARVILVVVVMAVVTRVTVYQHCACGLWHPTCHQGTVPRP